MFVILEIQSDGSTVEIFSNAYATRNEAEKEYFTTLAKAATSSIPIHSATMITQEGYYCKSECFKHEISKNN